MNRRSIVKGQMHQVDCAVREDGRSPAGEFLDALKSGAWDRAEGTEPLDEQIGDYHWFLNAVRHWANTGEPVYNAIVWQDVRTGEICDRLSETITGGEERVREIVGQTGAQDVAGVRSFSEPQVDVEDGAGGGWWVEVDGDAVIGDVDNGWQVLSALLKAGRAGSAAELVGVP